MAAPIASQILGEVIPYLELEKDNTEGLEEVREVKVPNIINMTVKDAEKELKSLGLEMKLNTAEEIDTSQVIIINQTPKEGITINSGTTIFCDIQEK